LQKNCVGTACHSSGTSNANFTIIGPSATHNSLLMATAKDGVSKYIVPGNLGASKLYQRITTGGVGTRMPKSGVDLTTTDTDMPADGTNDAVEIQAWISAGATGP
jgi:hypothetical protein